MSKSTEREVPLALMVQTPDEPGALHALTRVLLDHEANITHVDIAERREGLSTVYFELEDVTSEAADALIGDLEALPIVRAVERALVPEGVRQADHRGRRRSAGGSGGGGCGRRGR